jgi:hypothetical protein
MHHFLYFFFSGGFTIADVSGTRIGPIEYWAKNFITVIIYSTYLQIIRSFAYYPDNLQNNKIGTNKTLGKLSYL